MIDHLKPTFGEKNPDHIVLHAVTNNLKTENTASQTAKTTIDLLTSLKNNNNNVHCNCVLHCSKA